MNTGGSMPFSMMRMAASTSVACTSSEPASPDADPSPGFMPSTLTTTSA